MIDIVLVHGLWHGAWAWDAVRRHLDDAGLRSVAVELPMSSLRADTDVVRAALDAADRPVLLVGHSYGGAVITAAGDHSAVYRLVYVAAFQLEAGERISRVLPERDIAPTRLSDALRFSDDGQWVVLDPERAAAVLYGESARAADVSAAVARLRPVSRALFSSPAEVVAWRSVPSTYVVCTQDRAVAPQLQRAMAERASDVGELASGHTPLLTDPEATAKILIRLAARRPAPLPPRTAADPGSTPRRARPQ